MNMRDVEKGYAMQRKVFSAEFKAGSVLNLDITLEYLNNLLIIKKYTKPS